MRPDVRFLTDKTQESPLGEVLDFLRLLWAVDHRLKSTSKHMELSLGVTGPQRLVVRLVGQFPGISAGRLAQILHVHPSTLTGVLKRLVKGGYLERNMDPRDGRKALFCLTAAGRELDVPATGTVEDAVERVLSRLPRAQLAAAQEVFAVLAEELGVGQASLEESSGPSRPKKSQGLAGADEKMGIESQLLSWEPSPIRLMR